MKDLSFYDKMLCYTVGVSFKKILSKDDSRNATNLDTFKKQKQDVTL